MITRSSALILVCSFHSIFQRDNTYSLLLIYSLHHDMHVVSGPGFRVIGLFNYIVRISEASHMRLLIAWDLNFVIFSYFSYIVGKRISKILYLVVLKTIMSNTSKIQPCPDTLLCPFIRTFFLLGHLTRTPPTKIWPQVGHNKVIFVSLPNFFFIFIFFLVSKCPADWTANNWLCIDLKMELMVQMAHRQRQPLILCW